MPITWLPDAHVEKRLLRLCPAAVLLRWALRLATVQRRMFPDQAAYNSSWINTLAGLESSRRAVRCAAPLKS